MTKNKKRLTKKQLRRKRRRRILIVELIVLVLLLGGLFVITKLGKINFDSTTGTVATNKLSDKTKKLLTGYTTIAFFGVDNRSSGNYESGNSDSVMICVIDNTTKKIKIASVYRDTAMDVDGEGKIRKCNYAYNHGGAEEAMEMLNRNLDLNISNYVAVDFNALTEAVDAVGGIEIDLTDEEAKYMNNKGYIGEVGKVSGKTKEAIAVKGGKQTLNGVQATAYCRVRYTAGGDFKRAERQRTVVNKVVAKIKTSNVAQMNKLLDKVFPDISTNFSMSEILGMATAMKDYEIADTTGFPFSMKTDTVSQTTGSMDVPCTLSSNVVALYSYLYNKDDYEPSSTVQKISRQIERLTGLDEGDSVDYGF